MKRYLVFLFAGLVLFIGTPATVGATVYIDSGPKYDQLQDIPVLIGLNAVAPEMGGDVPAPFIAQAVKVYSPDGSVSRCTGVYGPGNYSPQKVPNYGTGFYIVYLAINTQSTPTDYQLKERIRCPRSGFAPPDLV